MKNLGQPLDHVRSSLRRTAGRLRAQKEALAKELASEAGTQGGADHG